MGNYREKIMFGVRIICFTIFIYLIILMSLQLQHIDNNHTSNLILTTIILPIDYSHTNSEVVYTHKVTLRSL